MVLIYNYTNLVTYSKIWNENINLQCIFFSWIKNEYDNPEVIITENGWSDDGELNDVGRIDYLKSHLQATLEARIVDGCNVTGYTHWSVIDNFEWGRGYS